MTHEHKALVAARAEVDKAHARVSGDDGYNYAAGQEYGLRFALRILDKHLAAIESLSAQGEAEAVGVPNKAAEGRQAYKDGVPREQNPYPQGTARYWQWSSGWLDERAFRPHVPAPVPDAVEILSWMTEAIRLLSSGRITLNWSDVENHIKQHEEKGKTLISALASNKPVGDGYVLVPRGEVERVTEIANRNEQSIEGDRLAVRLAASGESIR